MKHLVVAIAMFTAAGSLIAADHWTGTWNMNGAKSKFIPGPAPKSGTTTYSRDGEWTVLKSESVNASGKKLERSNKYKADGKEYPYEGPYGRGTISVTRPDDHNATATIKLDGGNTVTTKSVISKDGKTRTMTSTGTSAKGEKVDSKVVYDRQ